MVLQNKSDNSTVHHALQNKNFRENENFRETKFRENLLIFASFSLFSKMEKNRFRLNPTLVIQFCKSG
jgi:hypothetical protein